MIKQIKNGIKHLYRKDKLLFYCIIAGLVFILWLVLDKQFFAFDRARREHEEKFADEIIYTQELKSGDILYINRYESHSVYFWPECLYRSFYKEVFGRRTTKLGAGIMKQQELGYYSAVRIFYASKTDAQQEQGSFFTWFGKNQDELEFLVCVTPQQVYEGNTILSYPIPSEEWIIPCDTLGTEAIHGVDNLGYPAWYFILSADELRSDYVLFYGDQQLTYRDLMGFTWAEN